MDIKIRTQNKEALVDVSSKRIGIFNKDIVVYEGVSMSMSLGKYETEEECIEIINRIQNVIEDGFKYNKSGIIIEMP